MKWHRVIVTDADVRRAKMFRKSRDRSVGSAGRLTDETWTGHLAEDVFADWLDSNEIPYERQNDPNKADPWDFKIGTWFVDVKCANTTVEPQPDYGCNVQKRQHLARGEVNAYVHARFISDVNEVVLFGAISKAAFGEIAEERKVRDKVTQSFTVSGDMYECLISDLEDLEEFFVDRPCVWPDCGHWNGYMDGQLCGKHWLTKHFGLEERGSV